MIRYHTGLPRSRSGKTTSPCGGSSGTCHSSVRITSATSTRAYLTVTVSPDTGKAAGTVAPASPLGTLCPFGPTAVIT